MMRVPNERLRDLNERLGVSDAAEIAAYKDTIGRTR